MLQKIIWDKINGTKNAFFFLSQVPTHHSFTFNFQFLYDLKHKVRLSKTACRIFHFWFHFVFIKVIIIIFSTKCMDSLILKHLSKLISFSPKPLIFRVLVREIVWNDNQLTVILCVQSFNFFVVLTFESIHNNQGALVFQVAKLLLFGWQIWEDNYFE